MKTTSLPTTGDENMYAFPCWRTMALPLLASATWYKLESDVAKNTFPSATAGDVITPTQLVKESPFFFAGCRIERVQIRITTAGVNRSVHHRRRRLEPDLIVDNRVFASVETPFL